MRLSVAEVRSLSEDARTDEREVFLPPEVVLDLLGTFREITQAGDDWELG